MFLPSYSLSTDGKKNEDELGTLAHDEMHGG